MRRNIGLLVAILLLAAAVPAILIQRPIEAQQEPIEDRVAALEAKVAYLETFHPTPEPVIPETIPYRKLNKDKGDYRIETANLDTGQNWWKAPYIGQWLPYTPNAQWLNGDRVAYQCAYGFLEHEGEIVGRFAFDRVPGVTYGRVNDRYMEEGERYWDGTLAAPDAPPQLNDCKPNSGFTYEEWDGPDERPRVVFWSATGDVLDIRDYRNTATSTVKFRLFDVSPTRVTVVAYELATNLPVVVVYYDALGTGTVTADLP